MRGWSAFVVAALTVLSASAQQLNPTVKVLAKPQTSVPPECEEGLAPAVPRAIIAESPAEEANPARAVPPPSLDLKTQLRAVQIAAERGDRDAFNAALADARAAVASYPRGGERNAANDVLSVYGDIERLWDYQFSAPAGAFFDASTDFVSMMRRYPSYSSAIADQTLTVNGQTVYPTAETRQFLAAEAARRLDRLGVRTPTRIAEVPAPSPVPRTARAPVPQPHAAPPPITRRPSPKPAVRHAEKPARAPHHKTLQKTTKPPVKIARANTSKPQPHPTETAPPVPSPQPKPAPQPAPAPKPVVAAPVPAPMPKLTPQPAPAPKPVVAAPATPPVTAPAPAPQPAPQPTPTATESTSAPLPTDTMSTTPPPAPETSGTTATTATTASQRPESNEPQKSGGSVNLLVAIILIIVGIGVLIFLFRASD